MPITNPQEKFVHELCLVYDAEYQFAEGQQEMAQNATDQDLESAIREHIEQTQLHIRNLEEVFEQLGQQPQRQTSVVAQGLVSEAQQDIQEAQNDAIRDCLIDAAVLKVEHFEMGSYRGMVTGAQQMGQTEIVNLLNENLQQEEEAARIAEQSAPELLQKAMQGEEQEEGLVEKAKEKLSGQ
jgi:ferritin-like metal-binding protein YciE